MYRHTTLIFAARSSRLRRILQNRSLKNKIGERLAWLKEQKEGDNND